MKGIMENFGNIGAFVCFGISVLFTMLILVYLIAKLIRLDKKGRRNFLASVLKGKFLTIYVAAIPMFLANQLYVCEEGIWKSFLMAVEYSAKLIGLSFDFEKVSPLFDKCGAYRVFVYICFYLVFLNVIIFLLSLFQRGIHKYGTMLKWKYSPNRVFILGNNRDSVQILRSSKAARGEMRVIAGRLTIEEEKQLFIEDVPYLNTRSDEAAAADRLLMTAIEENRRRFSGGEARHAEETCCMIVNTGSDERNLHVCQTLCASIKTYTDEVRQTHGEEAKRVIVDLFSHIQVHVFGDSEFETQYLELVNASFGVIRYVNKHRQIAIDFTDKYPLTQFMTEEQIDTDRFLLREDVGVNVLLVGFGGTNQQIFLTSVANNQFLKLDRDGRESLKQVKYHIFDRVKAENNRNLNHGYYRYRNEFFTGETLRRLCADSLCDDASGNEYTSPVSYPYADADIAKDRSDYLPLPMLPAEEYYHHLDINDPLFYRTIQRILRKSGKDMNYIVIAFGSDLENIDLAGKIVEMERECGLDNACVFVRVRNGSPSSAIFSRENRCFAFGDEKSVVYDLENIKCSGVMKMALARNRVYEFAKSQKEIDAKYKWYVERTQIERDSNFYAILSLRSKLHMMGMDCVDLRNASDAERKDLRTVGKSEFFRVYAKDDVVCEDGSGRVKYPEDPALFVRSPRRTMAIQEHYRWNSYMITQGIVPSTIEQIRSDGHDGKNYAERRHGNLTTYEGLIDFYRIVGYDVIKYDYQLLDEIYELIAYDQAIVYR